MSATVLLKDIVDALEMVSDELPSFLDLDTGAVETVHRELLGLAEECADDEEPDLPAWQEEEWEVARRIVFSDRFRKLPTNFEVHEWAIMRDFADSVKSERIRRGAVEVSPRQRCVPVFQGHAAAAPNGVSLVCIPHRSAGGDGARLVQRESRGVAMSEVSSPGRNGQIR
jgi:hypothetical protein